MAQGPIDYTSGFGAANPLGGALEAMQAGARFGVLDQQRAGLQQQQVMREQQMLAAQAEQERQGQIDAEVEQLLRNPFASSADYQRLVALTPKDKSKAIQDAWAARSAEEKANILTFTGQVQSALATGNPEIAQRLLNERADAERNAGRTGLAGQWGTWAEIAKGGPDALRVVIGDILATVEGGGAVLDNIAKREQGRRAEEAFPLEQRRRMADTGTAEVTAEFARPQAEATLSSAQSDAVVKRAAAEVAPELARLGVQQTRANISNLQSQIGDRAVRQRLDAQRLALDTANVLGQIEERNGRIPEAAQKDVNAAAVASGTAAQQATRLNALADQIGNTGAWGGVFTSAADSFRKGFGSQDAPTLIRQEYVRMRNSLVSQSLPPGVASDRDIALAMEGFLPANANPQATASFLRGMAKVQSITAEVETARADWLANNRGSLGRAAQPFQAGRFRTVPGETFAGFTDRVTRELARPAEGSTGRAIEQIPDSGAPRAPAAPRPAQGAAIPPLPAGFAVDRR
jgi:hypothetical protein